MKIIDRLLDPFGKKNAKAVKRNPKRSKNKSTKKRKNRNTSRRVK